MFHFRYRAAIFNRETLWGVVGAAMLVSGMAGYLTVEWWAGPVYAALMP